MLVCACLYVANAQSLAVWCAVSGRSRGFGFVTYLSLSEAEFAISKTDNVRQPLCSCDIIIGFPLIVWISALDHASHLCITCQRLLPLTVWISPLPLLLTSFSLLPAGGLDGARDPRKHLQAT